uniref:ATP synthase subunit a n=1 Tax=Semnoderes armiger TaxID=1415233 RepID=A0A5H2QB04_9BILA|nr:ATP synthase F0 subunit 6 [Semnoderes armiger]AYF57120.1 ATP synthase F0 subunit 6 [Semnoderes armiger]
MLFFCLDPSIYCFKEGMVYFIYSMLFMMIFLFLSLKLVNLYHTSKEYTLFKYMYFFIDSLVCNFMFYFSRSGWSGIFFIMIVFFNIFSLYAYVYSMMTMIQMSMSLALVLWSSSVILGWYEGTLTYLSHFIPLGVPLILSFFMFFIEVISVLIRPVTLSVRLVANISVGHLLMSLVGFMMMMKFMGMMFGKLIIWLLIFLEVLTSFMQGYVFVLLGWVYIMDMKI